jgi:hypothetical protein
MKVDLTLDRRGTRVTVIGATSAVCGSLLYLVICNFVVAALTDHRIKSSTDSAPSSFITAPFTDDRMGINPDVLASAGRYFPNSPRLHMRLAEEKIHRNADWTAADFHARQAIRLSPHDYRPRLMLASIQEANNDLVGAEQSVRTALRLAPGNLEAHWLLGNLLVNTDRLGESFEHFRTAGSGDVAYFDAALQRIWNLSAANVDSLMAITPDNPRDRLALARFLLQRDLPLESGAVFRNIHRDALITNPESGRYLDSLIAVGEFALAHELWCVLMNRIDDRQEQPGNVISNGGFESDILTDFAQFDWTILPSKYARISIDSKNVRTGKRSLRIDFIGHETTRLDEIKQLILVRPGARYELQYRVKTEALDAPNGPRVVLFDAASSRWIGASEPVPVGSNDWRQERLEFSASRSAVVIAIQLQPRFSYEDPTEGTVWFDDFEIHEI